MHNWSLVCFTLLTQSAIGLVWVSVLVRWVAGGPQAAFSIWTMPFALTLTGLGLGAALAHLAKPRLAPHALRNLAVSWLSREVLLVQAFAGAVALLILLALLNVTSGQVMLETAACLLGGAVLYAMTRVYLLRTVPVWNSPATALEFAGSVLLLGGALRWMFTILGSTAIPGGSTEMIVAGIAMGAGVVIKASAMRPTLTAERTARALTWYETKAAPFSTRGILAARLVLNLLGIVLVVFSWSEPTRLGPIFSLACFASGEIIGRIRFYQSYQRMGL